MKRFLNFKKFVAAIIVANMAFWNVPIVAVASEISGVTPTGNTYNIEASKVSGSTGFRHYDKFNLTKGDIANLIYKDNYSKFVNLVNNKISINGLVNTMKNGNFYNGHAIFVSPLGFVVGSSGVLNVGSLSVLTPSQSKFDSFLNKYNAGNLSGYEYNADDYKALIKDSNGNIVINGKILAKEEVNLYGSDISIGDDTSRAGIIAGFSGNTAYDSESAAKTAFDSLVSNNITNADTFSLQDGKISIIAAKKSEFGDPDGDVKTSINVKNSDIGANEVEISAKSEVNRQERIDLAEAKVDVENSAITGDTVEITAEASQKKDIDNASIIGDGQLIATAILDIFESDTPSVGALWGATGKANAEVTVKNSTINALGATEADDDNPDLSVLIHAEASSETAENANFLTPSIIDFIGSDEAKIGEYFSSGVYNGFEGPRSSAKVNVENSTINAIGNNSKNIEISTNASSSFDANNRLLAIFLPIGLYGVGTGTESKAIVKDSVIKATNGDVDVNAFSTNENSIEISNDSTFSIKLEESYIGMLLNNTVKTETEASIISSVVEADNLTVLAVNLSESESDVTMQAIAGEKGQGEGEEVHGNSAVSLVGLLNRSDNKVTALIKDSTVNTKEDTSVIAQSLNVTSNSADASIDDKMVQHPKTFDQKWKDWLKEKQFKYLNISLFDRIKGKTKVTATQSATLEAGGVVVWNNTNNTTTAKIENSTVTAGDAKVQANTVDLISNSATSDTQGEGKYGISLAVVVNEQNNTTNALIDKSEIEADNVTVDATTELPMNQGKLTFGLNLPFKIAGVEKLQVGAGFASEPNGKWDVSAIYPTPEKEEGETDFEITGIAEQNVRETYEDLKPKVRFEGFFNNIAQTNSVGSNASVSAAVVYNEVNNNTTASIQNGSNITINDDGKLIVNAVNSVMGYNGLGLFDFIIKKINYKIPGQEDWEYEPTVDGGKFGLGANFAWDNYTNNATAKIDSSSVDAEKGSVNVDSATEQSYLSVVMTGGKSETLGINGSIHVQNIKGDTVSQISNIQDDNSIKAKDVSVDAGNAHIKTTAGKVEVDEDTNQAKWKEQNPDADDKYTREAKDEITNIIVQGAFTSQYEEVDNTVQQNSAGVAMGTSVNVTNIDRSVKSVVENAVVEATNDFTVNADTLNRRLDVEIAAAFSGGVTQKEAEVQNIQQDADGAQDDEGDIFGNLFDGEDEYMRNPVGNDLAELQGQFSMSIAGAVDIISDDTKAQAYIKDSEVSVGNNLKVNANRESSHIAFGGSLGKSKKVGAGASVNYYKQEGFAKAYIDNSTVKYTSSTPKLDILATVKNWILDIAIGAGVAVNNAEEGKGFEAAVGGSASINTLKPTIEAYIDNSTVGMAENKTGKIDTTINAKSDIDIINIAGGGSYMHGGSSGLSAGAAFNYNNIKNTISTYVKNSTLNDINKLSMLSDADNNLNDFAVAGSIVTGTDGGTFSFAGGIDVDYIHDTISSKVIASTIFADDDIEVKANSNSDNLAVAGTFDITTADTGVGINGDVVVNVFRNDITSEIDKDSNIKKAKDVKVSATSTEKANVIPIGVAVATGEQYLMAAANVGVNVIDNSVKSYASGHIGTGENSQKVNSVNVSAYDETTLYSRGGTVAASSTSTVADLAASINVDILDKTVEAKIKDADIKANNDATATATSINSMGGTKGDDNKYSRDDVTTDAYKEKMLTKNSDGEYVGLKQDSDFLNWNMFFDVSAGAHASIAGAGIVKVIQNEVTAEVTNSDIESKNLSVIANDYSIKNIIAGAVAGSDKGAIGLQALVTKDRSTTSALISNGSTLDISDTIDLEAINRKDNHQIMVAGSGAGKFSVNANVIVNDITDSATAKIDNSSSENEIKAGTLKINADEDMNASHIIVTGGGAANIALSVSPLINNYDGTTEAAIKNATIKDAAIDMDANSNIETLDISVGASGVGQGLAGVGIAIKNNYTNTVKSYIDNSVINTLKSVDIDANSRIDSNNWIASLAVAGQGVDIVVNVLLNNIITELEAGIKNSEIENAGAISINTNKDKKDEISNKAIGLGVAGEGASALVNVVQNIYDNTVKSYVENTSSENINSLSITSNSDRYIEDINVGISVAGIGASLLANALVNQIDSSTSSYVDTKDKILNIENALSLNSKDQTEADNTMAMINAAGLGVSAGTNINLYYANNLAKSEVLSNSNGKINAGSSSIVSDVINAIDNHNVSVALGFGAIAANVELIDLGKRTGTYSDAEKESTIKNSVDYTKDKYDKITANDKEEVKNLYTPTTSAADIETGSVARVNGNLKTINNTEIKANSRLKGIGSKEKLSLTNVDVSVGVGTVGVGIKDAQLANTTLAEISGGNVESTSGDVSVSATSTAKVDITNDKVTVSGVNVSGGSAIYNNSAETVAQVKNAKVTTYGDMEVKSNSTSNSSIESSNVIETGVNIVSLDYAENTDKNKSVAIITGNTDIEAGGKLTLHSTVNTDLKSTKETLSITGASIVGISENSVDAGTISRAIIENVNGKISANGIDIITDYDNISSFSKANVTSVKFVDVVTIDKSGAKLTADFKSGIDSLTGLTIDNSGDTHIITARDNSEDGKGIVSTAEINNVHVSLEGFVASVSANSENTATSATVLKAKEHNADNLYIDSYLNSKAISNAGATKATVGIGVNVVNVDANDTSTLKMDIAGANTITKQAIITATHTSNVSSDMSAFNFGGLIGGGQRIRIDSELTADTTGNIGGNFNANSASITFDTVRNSTMSKSSGSGSGIVNVDDTQATNKLTGSSTLTIDRLYTDSEIGNNNFIVKNTSNNTLDVTSSNGSGGFINVSEDETTTTFNTSTTMNVKNSNINSNNKVGFEVGNNAVIKDTASMKAGGFVSVADDESTNTYDSTTKLTIDNTKINAKNIETKTSSDISTPSDKIIDYVGGAGGVVAENEMKLTNTLTQTSETNITKSELYASEDVVLNAITSSMFKQKTDTTVGGFVAIPRSKNWLNVTNNNKITIDSDSKLMATDELEIEFDSSNTLEARSLSEAHHFGFKDPVAESYLTLIINNTLENSGSIEGGNLVDINYMANSTNDLTQYAYSEAHAAIPTTSEDGKLTKTVNNVLNNNSGADIIAGKDIDVSYSIGKGSNSSTIAYKSVCYALFGIPITTTGSKSNAEITHNKTLKNDGEFVAGQSNARYMKINRDGTIDKKATKGFYEDDYNLNDGDPIDGQKIKDQTLASIQIEIDNVQETIDETNATITSLSNTIDVLEGKKAEVQEKLDEVNNLISNGYELKSSENFNNIMRNDIKAIVTNGDNSISEDEFNVISSAYASVLDDIEEYNKNHPTSPASIPSVTEFFNNVNNYSVVTEDQKDVINDLSNNQKTTVENGYNTVNGRLSETQKSEFTIYNNQYIMAENPSGSGSSQTCDEIRTFNAEIANMEERLSPYVQKKSANEQNLVILNMKSLSLQIQYNIVSDTPAEEYAKSDSAYSIVFNDINPKPAHINIDGADNRNISGDGIFNVALNGVKVDNYSTRTVVFNDLNIDTDQKIDDLIIDGKSHSQFADKEQAVSGSDAYSYLRTGEPAFDNITHDGVHYVNDSNGIVGITVNNYYDTNNPFISTFDIPHPTDNSYIFFDGDINTKNDLNVWNESGGIVFVTDTINVKDQNISAINRAISFVMDKEDNEARATKYVLGENSKLFAADGINIMADEVDLKGDIKIGYSDRNITITDDMIKEENLIVDPTSGEKNMINIGINPSPYLSETNNIKAIYKDGQIYLYDIQQRSTYSDLQVMSLDNTPAYGSITGSVTFANGYQNIKIDNQTNKPLNVAEVQNTKLLGKLDVEPDVTYDEATIIKNTVDNAKTEILSGGKISLNKLIRNSIQDEYNDQYLPEQGGVLSVVANGGIDLTEQTIEDIKANSIVAGGTINITNTDGTVNVLGDILNTGDINLANSGDTNITSRITNTNGNISIANNTNGGINFATSSIVSNSNGNVEISNSGEKGIDVSGLIEANRGDITITNSNSDIKIGEYETDNNNYITSSVGNVVINQTGGNILNNILDPSNRTHSNYDIGNPDHAYKTLITAGKNLTINVTDGDIGTSSSNNPGFSVNATTRDYTDSINVNVSGNVIARAINENNTDNRLINLRANKSSLNIDSVEASGNVMLTASDWKQEDMRPTPEDNEYYTGYSVLNASNGNNPNIKGQNISVIASDKIGEENKKLVYEQDTQNNPNSAVSFEAENDLNLAGRANSNNDAKIYQLISKRGNIDLDLESNAEIEEITSGKGLIVTQKAQNLTIKRLGTTGGNPGEQGKEFDDILYPHDDLIIGGSPDDPDKSVVPNYAIISVLDAMDTPERSDSNLKIYSAYVKGNHGENTEYYPDGSRLADYTLMADNIYANSAKAPNSSVHTKAYPKGYKQQDTTYTDIDFDGNETIREAEGLNAYGEGEELSLDIIGVDRDKVDALIPNAQRNNYKMEKHKTTTPYLFKNKNDRLAFYNYDFKANEVVVSVNDYVNTDRGVSVDTIYADNAYVNTHDTNFKVQDGIIDHYAEFRNKDKIGIVDNDFRRLLKQPDIQLYTEKTGSFGLKFNKTINMKTTAPTVYNEPHKLVNGYHSEWNFFNKGVKNAHDITDRSDRAKTFKKEKEESRKRISMRFNTLQDKGLISNYKIYDISTTGALIENKNFKVGNNLTLNLKFDDVDINVDAVVINSDGIYAGVKFVNMPEDVKSKILYRYMQINTEKLTKK